MNKRFTISTASKTRRSRSRKRRNRKAGAVMMEYVIIGSLVVAAAVFVVLKFSKAITARGEQMTHAVAAQVNTASQAGETAVQASQEAQQAQQQRENQTKEQL